jgi:hypothetical protein
VPQPHFKAGIWIVFIIKKRGCKLKEGIGTKAGLLAQQQGGGQVPVFDGVLLGRKPYINGTSQKDLEMPPELNSSELEEYSLRYRTS